MDHIPSSVQPEKEGPKLKKMPKVVTKGDINNLYPNIQISKLNRWACDIMARNRNLKYDDVKNEKLLYPIEWKMLVNELLDFPEGYEKFFR